MTLAYMTTEPNEWRSPLSHEKCVEPDGHKEDGFGKSGHVSSSDVLACFIGTFLGLVAAALLIAVLGLV